MVFILNSGLAIIDLMIKYLGLLKLPFVGEKLILVDNLF